MKEKAIWSSGNSFSVLATIKVWFIDTRLFCWAISTKLIVNKSGGLFSHSLISIRQIYYFDTWAIIWHGIVCWFMAFSQYLQVLVCCDQKIVLHIKTRKETQVSKVQVCHKFAKWFRWYLESLKHQKENLKITDLRTGSSL